MKEQEGYNICVHITSFYQIIKFFLPVKWAVKSPPSVFYTCRTINVWYKNIFQRLKDDNFNIVNKINYFFLVSFRFLTEKTICLS